MNPLPITKLYRRVSCLSWDLMTLTSSGRQTVYHSMLKEVLFQLKKPSWMPIFEMFISYCLPQLPSSSLILLFCAWRIRFSYNICHILADASANASKMYQELHSELC